MDGENDLTAPKSASVTQPKKLVHFAPYCSPIEFLPPPLEGFAYACIDDRLYIFGGSDLNGQETADLYSFSLKCGWQRIESQGQNNETPSARVASSMTVYNQKLYLFGGVNEKQGWLNDFYEFDTETSIWKRLNIDGCPSPRDKCALVSSRGKIYLYGGFGPRERGVSDNGQPANSNGVGNKPENYSNGTKNGDGEETSQNGENKGKVDEHGSGDGNQGTKEEHDLKSAMEEAKHGQIGAEFDYFNDFYCFDPSIGAWSSMEVDETNENPTSDGENSKTAVPPGLAAYTVSAMADKLLYFGGKTSAGERTNTVYCFALGLKKWLPLPIRDDSGWPVGRSFHSTATVNDRYLITFGGRDGDDWERDDLWVLDTNQSQWLFGQCEGVGGVSSPCARYGHAVVVLPDADSRLHLVIYGGSAELDPASGVAQDVLTDMYVVLVDELLQVCTPAVGNVEEELKESKHNHHSLHHHRAAGNEENTQTEDEPSAKVPRCDDCIDL